MVRHQLVCTGLGAAGVEGLGGGTASGHTALMYGDSGLCRAVRFRWVEVSVTGQSRCRSSIVVHTGTANERLPSRPTRPGALRLASRARPTERDCLVSMASSIRRRALWLVLNIGGAVAVVILPSTLPYFGHRPYEQSHSTHTLPRDCRDWAASSMELEISLAEPRKRENVGLD